MMEEMSTDFIRMMQAAAAEGPSLEDVKSNPVLHGKLVGCSYYSSSSGNYFSSSGGTQFNSNTLLDISVILIDGVLKISYSNKQAFQPTNTTVYQPKQDVLATLQEFIERENLAAWSALKYHNPFPCTGYSSSASISLHFDDRSIGGNNHVREVISVDAACQYGGCDVIQQFRNILETAVQDADVLSVTTSESPMSGFLGVMGAQSSCTPVQEKSAWIQLGNVESAAVIPTRANSAPNAEQN